MFRIPKISSERLKRLRNCIINQEIECFLLKKLSFLKDHNSVIVLPKRVKTEEFADKLKCPFTIERDVGIIPRVMPG